MFSAKSDTVGLESLVWLLCSRWIATPLAASAGIKPRVHMKAEDNPILETYYTTQSRNPPQVNKVSLSKLRDTALQT